MKRLRDIDSVGWGFFGLVALVLWGPLWYATAQGAQADASPALAPVLGAIGAALGAAVVAWAVNDVLYRLGQRRAEASAAAAAQPPARAKQGKRRKGRG